MKGTRTRFFLPRGKQILWLVGQRAQLIRVTQLGAPLSACARKRTVGRNWTRLLASLPAVLVLVAVAVVVVQTAAAVVVLVARRPQKASSKLATTNCADFARKQTDSEPK